MINKISTLILFFAFVFTSKAQSDYEKQTMVFAKDLATKIKETKKLKIAVSDFLDNDENLTELGKAIAEDISVNILNEAKDSFKVVERSNLKAILKEQKLASTGLLDQLTVKKLGQIKVADAIIIGTITPFGNSFRITIKVLDTETGLSIAATSGNLSGTDDIKNLFNKKISINNTTSTTVTPQQDNKLLTNKQDEITASRDTEGCNSSNGTSNGDYCFYNNTSFDVVVQVMYYRNFNTTDVLTIKAKETKCVYGVWVQQADFFPNRFYVFKKEGYQSGWFGGAAESNAYDSGTFQTIKCKTVTYTIK